MKTFYIFLFLQLINLSNAFTPLYTTCSLNKKNVLKNSLILLHSSVNNIKWEPPDGYVPKKKKWEPPEGYVPESIKIGKAVINEIDEKINELENKDDLFTDNSSIDINIEIDNILIKIEKIKKNVMNIKTYKNNIGK
jgi:hypothetical protein